MKSKRKSSSEPKVEGPKRKSLFDHVKHIRSVQDPSYYTDLSEDDRKSFNHFMLVRALSMDDTIVEDMASLYQIFDKIPSPQFYQLLIAIVPCSNRYCPWIKSRVLRHNKGLLDLVAKRFQVSRGQANQYINILLASEQGQNELVAIGKAFGLEDKEIEDLFETKKEE